MKRRVLIVLLFVLLGAIVNVAIAWTIALRVRAGGSPARTACVEIEDWGNWSVSRFDNTGVVHVNDWLEVGDCYRPGPHPHSVLPSWGGLREPPVIDKATALAEWEEAHWDWSLSRSVRGTGWPMISLWCEVDWFNDHGEFRTDPSCGGLWFDWMYDAEVICIGVPLRPVPLGFLVDTSLHASILWLTFCGPFALRRRLRRKSGRCIKCGYDLRGAMDAGCPECGWGREEVAHD